MSEEILLNEYKYEVLKGISVSGSRAAIAQVEHIMNEYEKLADESVELKKLLKLVWDVNKPGLDQHVQDRIRKYYDEQGE